MKYKSIIAAMLTAVILLSGCMDDFADLNTDQTTVSKGNVRYLFTEGLRKFEPSDYLMWFYNGAYVSKWSQAYVSVKSTAPEFNFMGEQGGQGGQTYEVLKVANNVKYLLKNNLSEAEAAQYKEIQAMFFPLLVYLGLLDTDMTGDYAYTEACLALYTNPMLLTPKFDKVSDLYTLWLEELDHTIDVLLNPVFVNGQQIEQVKLGSQDFVYGGDTRKWAKLANSLKLKIAVRLLHQDKQRALSIAEEVAKSPAGVLSSLEDDFLYCRGSQEYHFGDAVSLGAPSKHVADFLTKNLDPRVRFFYMKNDFNAKVVQTFIDQEKELPAYIDALVETENVEGKRKFKAWKGAGEPWVRYFGAPIEVNASQMSKYADYFESNRFKIKIGDKEKTYQPMATFNEEMIRGQKDYTFPDSPTATTMEDRTDHAWHGLFFSTAEVNLYLAELKLLGAILPETAESYYKRAVEMSVKAYDRVAGKNQIPYYASESPYYGPEECIALKANEVETLLAQEDYTLSGTDAEKLEKVYIQQYIHFIYSPNDLFVTVRRSGIPRKNSKLIAWEEFSPNLSVTEIPRRFEVGPLETSDLLYKIKKESYERQGFTVGKKINPNLLNTERVWQDKGAPNFGEGPNF